LSIVGTEKAVKIANKKAKFKANACGVIGFENFLTKSKKKFCPACNLVLMVYIVLYDSYLSLAKSGIASALGAEDR
jgi:hypothetical protein